MYICTYTYTHNIHNTRYIPPPFLVTCEYVMKHWYVWGFRRGSSSSVHGWVIHSGSKAASTQRNSQLAHSGSLSIRPTHHDSCAEKSLQKTGKSPFANEARKNFYKGSWVFAESPDAYLSIWPLAKFFSMRFFLKVYGKELSQRPDHHKIIWKTVMNLSDFQTCSRSIVSRIYVPMPPLYISCSHKSTELMLFVYYISFYFCVYIYLKMYVDVYVLTCSSALSPALSLSHSLAHTSI